MVQEYKLHKLNFDAELNLILVHPFPFDASIYLDVLRSSEPLPFNILVPDLYGFGRSDPYRSTISDLSPYSEIVLDILKKNQTSTNVLGGCSMGGYVSLDVTSKHPDLIEGLLLIDSQSSDDSLEKKKQRISDALSLERLSSTTRDTLDIYKEQKFVKDFVTGLANAVLSEGHNKEQFTYVTELMYKQKIKGIADALRGMAGRRDTTDLIKSFKSKILIIHGVQDKIIPIEKMNKLLDLNPNLKLEKIKDSGHLPMVENPHDFNKVILSFMDSFIKVS